MQVDPGEIETLIAAKREARAARRASSDGGPFEPGAVVSFAVAVFAAGSKAGRPDHYWSYHVSSEPGSVFPLGITEVTYRGNVASLAFSGRFHVVVGDVHPATVPAAGVEWYPAVPAPRWAADLPANVYVGAQSPSQLRRLLARRIRHEARITERLMASVYPFLEHIASEFTPQLNYRCQFLDRDDVISEGWRRAYQLLEIFAGPQRPSVPWSTAVYRSCRRDMHRALHGLDGTSEAVAAIRAASSAHPDITEPAALQRLLMDQAAKRRRSSGRARPDSPPKCQFSLQQIVWALETPRVVSWHDADSPRHMDARQRVERNDSDRSAESRSGFTDGAMAEVDSPAGDVADRLVDTSGVAPAVMLDVMTDLGVGSGGNPASASLASLRRRVLAPFILAGESSSSETVLRRAGNRARHKLFARDELLGEAPLRDAWRMGITPEEARTLDRDLEAHLAGTPVRA